MHAPAREEWEQLGQQAAHERERPRVRRFHRHRGARLSERVDEPVGLDRQAAVTVVAQPALHVPQTVLVRYQLDVTLSAERVELAYLLGGERARGRVYLGVVAVREGVLHVELQLVDLPRREPVDEVAQRLHRRDLVARNVDHHAACGHVGVIPDRPRGEGSVVQASQLREGCTRVEQPGVVAADHVHAVVADAQLVTLRRQRGIDTFGRDGVRHEPVAEFDDAWVGEEVHASSRR